MNTRYGTYIVVHGCRVSIANSLLASSISKSGFSQSSLNRGRRAGPARPPSAPRARLALLSNIFRAVRMDASASAMAAAARLAAFLRSMTSARSSALRSRSASALLTLGWSFLARMRDSPWPPAFS